MEEVHGARFTEKSSSELTQDAVRLHEDSPATLRILCIVGRMHVIFVKRRPVLHFNWSGPNGDGKMSD